MTSLMISWELIPIEIVAGHIVRNETYGDMTVEERYIFSLVNKNCRLSVQLRYEQFISIPRLIIDNHTAAIKLLQEIGKTHPGLYILGQNPLLYSGLAGNFEAIEWCYNNINYTESDIYSFIEACIRRDRYDSIKKLCTISPQKIVPLPINRNNRHVLIGMRKEYATQCGVQARLQSGHTHLWNKTELACTNPKLRGKYREMNRVYSLLFSAV